MSSPQAPPDPATGRASGATPPHWARLAAGPVRPGEFRRFPNLARVPRLLGWLAEARSDLATHSADLVEHLKTSEWFLDNYTHIHRAVRQVRQDMPRRFLRHLPILRDGEAAGLVRSYVLANVLFHEAGLSLDATRVRDLVKAFQRSVQLNMAELWALPAFLRLCALEELTGAIGRVCTIRGAPLAPPPFARVPNLDEDETAARCIRTLRSLNGIDWKAFFVDCAVVEHILATDPAGIYARSDFETRDRCRKCVERVARRTRTGEGDVAQRAVALAADHHPGDPRLGHVGYYLLDAGRLELEDRFGYRPSLGERFRRTLTGAGITALIAGVAVALVATLAVPAWYLAAIGATTTEWTVSMLLMLIPASSLAVAVTQWCLTSTLPPRVLPKLDFGAGIDPQIHTLVVVPCLLGDAAEAEDLARQLELHYLRNPDPQLQFALLTDWADAPEEHMPGDEAVLGITRNSVGILNKKYAVAGPGPFHLLHRRRKWNARERAWMGWERKRGKLEELNRLLLSGHCPELEHVVGDPQALRDVHFVITLDAGTVLPTGTAARLVGTLAHPLNRAETDADSGRVVRGYTVIQPRVEITPVATTRSGFTRIYAGDAAIDIYSLAVSDVYQDLCGEGIYIGKGIYDVAAFARSLEGRVPENALVSHDHFEGLHGRAGLASDIVVYEDYPPQYLAFARRLHRWVRGDWQLLPWLFGRVPHAGTGRIRSRLDRLGRWILFDNLRRSLLAPALLVMLAADWLWLPGNPLIWALLAILAPAAHVFTALITGLARGPRRDRVRVWFAGVAHIFRQNVGRWLLFLAFLPHEALVLADAIVRTMYRMTVSRRRLLEWRTAEHTAMAVARRPGPSPYWIEMASCPVVGVGLGIAIAFWEPASLPWALPLLAVWAGAPQIAWWMSRTGEGPERELPGDQRAFLRLTGRRTWFFFESFVGPADQWLPPDNFQEHPRGEVAHRTSPTNIGMYLVSTVAAHDLGWIGTTELLLRLRNTFDTIERLEVYRGHVLNWYDTRTLEPLLPRYVSTVDSGNLVAALLTAKQTCRDTTALPVLPGQLWAGLQDCIDLLGDAIQAVTRSGEIPQQVRIAELHGRLRQCLIADRTAADSWAEVLHNLQDSRCASFDQALVSAIRRRGKSLDSHALKEVRIWLERVHHHLRAMRHEVAQLAPWAACIAATPDLDGPAARMLAAALRGLAPAAPLCTVPQAGETVLALLPAARRELADSGQDPAVDWCDQLADAVRRGLLANRALTLDLEKFATRVTDRIRAFDFSLVYDPETNLLHIGYDVSGGQLDPNRYDLLASEARIASFLAIAKGDVPVKHWYFLGRPVTRVRRGVTLLSWGGTMFEYLMPPLFMDSESRTLLATSCHTAVDAQIHYGRRHGVPWGISESGFHHFDAARNYQYRAFGVPGLGLKRGLAEDLVIAPYASAVALEYRPHEVVRNLQHLAELGGLGTYGFYEAVDFTPARVRTAERFAVVRSHMAHHQGMILAAIDNGLCGRPLARRFHATALAQAAELLLHERVPVGVSAQFYHEEVVAPPAPLFPRRQVMPWHPDGNGPVPEVHLLSNGRLTTALTDAGGGCLHWRGLTLTRAVQDPIRDATGSWIYLRDEADGALWSACTEPVGVRPVEQQVTFHGHMAEYHRRERGVFLRMEIGVAPREDVEARILVLTNEHDVARRLTVTASLEPVLAPVGEDTRHPAFARLFIESEYRSELGGLLFRRRSRSPGDRVAVLVHTVLPGHGVRLIGYETDRRRFVGRNRDWQSPAALSQPGGLSGTSGAVLDPVSALQVEVELGPRASTRLAFLTFAAGAVESALEQAGRLRSLDQVDWLFEDARNDVARSLRAMRMLPRLMPTVQRLTSLLVHPHPSYRSGGGELGTDRLGKPGLWRHGISGDLPIVLATLEDTHGARLVSELLLAHRWLHRARLAFDLVLLVTTPSGYAGDDTDRIARLIAMAGSADLRHRRGGIFVLHADQMRAEELRLLRTAARVYLHGAGDHRLAELLDRWRLAADLPPKIAPPFAVEDTAQPVPDLPAPIDRVLVAGPGGFAAQGREYVIHCPAAEHTPAPWCNVLTNPDFGCLVSESALGMTWSQNSSERRLTPWHNDPVIDPPAEAVYLRDEETGEFWTPTRLPCGPATSTIVRHGVGFTRFECACHGLEQSLTVMVARDDPVKVVSLTVRNVWQRQRRITATYFADLVLGTHRPEFAAHTTCEYDAEIGALFARNAWNPEFAERVAFLASDAPPHGVTVDRREFLGRYGDLARPAALTRWGLSGAVRPDADPCFAMMVHLDLAPDQTRTVRFLFGDATDRGAAWQLVARYRSDRVRAAARERVAEDWEELLGAIEVRTPNPAMDIALNRWLLYQAVTSRIEGRTGMYQSSGAFGFRDQLQDVLALVHAAPERVRDHILVAAARQFEAGDVLHWWHPPGARGVRTRCSDDLLWLPFVASHYVLATGDRDILDVPVPFLAGDPLGAKEVERYADFTPSDAVASLLEHCRRALQRGATSGPHGLPLIGSCDWNDGLDRVGVRGRGESVWLAWFTVATMDAFAAVLDRCGQTVESRQWTTRARELAATADDAGWDGGWYLRAWFDDGTPIGSARSTECRIDVIAQAWAAISQGGAPERVRTALAAAQQHLVSEEPRLVRLLDPPFDTAPEDPGYIKAYPPGVRENGGQYTHAATWLGWAYTTLGDGAEAERIFRLLNPLERCHDQAAVDRYRVEPYVVAADVYGGPVHAGRGGWTWYTGAAAWLWRLGIERILGLRRDRGDLLIDPCIPPTWPGFEATVRLGTGRCHVTVDNSTGAGRGVAHVQLDGVDLAEARIPATACVGAHEVLVTLGTGAAQPAGRRD